MSKVTCPFCGNVLDTKDDDPETTINAAGFKYTCHKVICRNKNGHPDRNNIAVVFKLEDNK